MVTRVLEHYEQGIPFRRQAVLFRAGSHSNSLELELARRNIRPRVQDREDTAVLPTAL